jgi:RNA polymerase sigma-70 factor (ECF subfamily)
MNVDRSSSIETDWPDIQASIQGDDVAFTRLIQRYENDIAAQMWRFTRERDVLNELVQDVFVEVYFSLKNYKGKSPLLHWIRRIATRVGYRFWKNKARDRQRNQELLETKLEAIQPEQHTTPSETGDFLYTLLETLPAKERLILTLHYFEGYEIKEIAEQTGWSQTMIKVRSFRARQKLKSQLERAGFGS